MRLEAGRELVAQMLQSFRTEDGSIIHHTLAFLVEVEKGPLWRQYLLNPTVSTEDVLYVGVAFIGVMLCRLAISGGSSGYLRRVPCISKKIAKSTNCVRRGKLHKFGENVWYTLWHTFACIWGIYVLWSEWGTAEVPGWPRLHMEMPDGRCCLAFINVETKRKDYGILFLHHVLTITLVAFSYCCSYWKLGMVVLLLHDMGDVFLYLSKSLHYSRIQSNAVEISFGTFVVVYFVTRLVIFPIHCVVPTQNMTLIKTLTQDFVSSFWRLPGGVALPFFLIILQVLHVYWFWCIIRMVFGLIKAIRSSESLFVAAPLLLADGNRADCEDVRSEDEDEEEEPEKPVKEKKNL
ncbi:hypothetical protein Esti_002552 [Eimeria stiedai]